MLICCWHVNTPQKIKEFKFASIVYHISAIIDTGQETTRLHGTFNGSFTRSNGRRVTKERPFASTPRLCVASIYRHGNKLCARDRKAATPSHNLANGKLRNGRNRAFPAHRFRSRLFIRNSALIRKFFFCSRRYQRRTQARFSQDIPEVYTTGFTAPLLVCRWYMRTPSSSIERNLIFVVKREDESSLCNCAQR